MSLIILLLTTLTLCEKLFILRFDSRRSYLSTIKLFGDKVRPGYKSKAIVFKTVRAGFRKRRTYMEVADESQFLGMDPKDRHLLLLDGDDEKKRGLGTPLIIRKAGNESIKIAARGTKLCLTYNPSFSLSKNFYFRRCNRRNNNQVFKVTFVPQPEVPEVQPASFLSKFSPTSMFGGDLFSFSRRTSTITN